jgi:hypothetical protein
VYDLDMDLDSGRTISNIIVLNMPCSRLTSVDISRDFQAEGRLPE